MQAGTTMLGRRRFRHDLRTLTYVTLDDANGGVVRNITHEGIAVQAVAATCPRQQVRVRFELRYPRLRVDTRAEIVWANFSGLCGVRFLDLPPQTARQIDEWIFGNLLEGFTLASDRGIIFPVAQAAAWHLPAPSAIAEEKPVLPRRAAVQPIDSAIELPDPSDVATMPSVPLDWLSQPLSGESLAWTVNTLIISSASLLFALIFLSVTGEAPKWPLAMAFGATLTVSGLYWGFFKLFGGTSLGARLARLAANGNDLIPEEPDRFR